LNLAAQHRWKDNLGVIIARPGDSGHPNSWPVASQAFLIVNCANALLIVRKIAATSVNFVPAR
jgi:hypothetical protein